MRPSTARGCDARSASATRAHAQDPSSKADRLLPPTFRVRETRARPPHSIDSKSTLRLLTVVFVSWIVHRPDWFSGLWKVPNFALFDSRERSAGDSSKNGTPKQAWLARLVLVPIFAIRSEPYERQGYRSRSSA